MGEGRYSDFSGSPLRLDMREKIFESKYSGLPAILFEDVDVDLSDKELVGLLNRMRLFDQLRFELSEWEVIQGDSEAVRSFLDRIELRSALCLALSSNPAEYSWWSIHTILESSSTEREYVSSSMLAFFANEVPSLNFDKRRFGGWVSSAAEMIQCGLDTFFSAKSVPSAWTAIVALNSLAGFVFSGISRQRIAR